MLAGSNQLPFPSKDGINKYISDVEIFRFYLGKNFEIGGKTSSPFREDLSPSFGIFHASNNGILMFNDFGVGAGDAIKFVQLLLGLKDYKESLEKITADFNLPFKTGYKCDNPNLLTTLKDLPEVRKKKTELEIKTRPWNSADKAFWSQYGISRKTLELFNVVPLQCFFINGELRMCYKPTYAYIFKKDWKITYKIYFPFAHPDYKWLSNVDASIHQGYTQLPPTGEILIITKSLKDIMSIYDLLDIPAIAPQNEGTRFKDSVMQEYLDRFKQVYLLYDNDYNKIKNHGQIAANRLIETYPSLKNLCIGSEHISKDFTDLVKNVGPHQSISIFHKLFDEV